MKACEKCGAEIPVGQGGAEVGKGRFVCCLRCFLGEPCGCGDDGIPEEEDPFDLPLDECSGLESLEPEACL